MSLRVLLISQQVRSVRSGVGSYARVLLDGLRDVACDCTVATWSGETDPERFPGARWASLGSAPALDPTPGAFWSLGRRVSRFLRRTNERFDVVHFLDAREAHATARSEGPRWIGTVHDDYAATAPRAPWGLWGRAADPWRRWLYYAWLRNLERRTYGRFDRLLANSRATRDSLQRLYALPPDRMQIIPLCAAKPSSAVDEVALRGDPALLFAGGNYYRKGLDTCVRALPLVLKQFERAHLHVAGEDRAQRSIRDLASRLGVLDRLSFWGRVAPERLAAMMRGARAFLLPARREALGLVYLEAFASQCPVVASGEGGVTDLVADGRSGLVVPAEDPEALAGAVVRLAGDEALRRDLVAGARRVAASRTPERLLEATLAAYEGRDAERAADPSDPSPRVAARR